MYSAFEIVRAQKERGAREAKRLFRDERGQATVEAAFAIPIVFLLLLALIQPAILLYDRMVMSSAAAEGCRILVTGMDYGGGSQDLCEDFIRRRLGSIPQQDCFHVHSGGCSWEIEMTGGESSEEVSVSIATEVKPLPLFDAGMALLGLVNGNGNLVVEVSSSMPTQPHWVSQSEQGLNPDGWTGAWLDEE